MKLPHLALVVLLLGAASCRATSSNTAARSAAPKDLRELALFDGATGFRESWSTLLDDVSRADVVVIGELHGHPVGLPWAEQLWEDVLARDPHSALALEFVTRDCQQALDRYLDGSITFEQLRARAKEIAGCGVDDHRAMIEAARAAGRPVFGANTSRPYNKIAREQGYDALWDVPAAEQHLFDVPPVMPAGGYRNRFMSFMRGGGDDGFEDEPYAGARALDPPASAQEEAIFRSQALWDGTMSGTVADALAEGLHPVLLEVGQFHCDRDGGTVQLLRRRCPDARVLVVSVTSTWSELLRAEDYGRADYVVYVGPSGD
ncbi:MAG: ChaN family lipoprotein [Planctomycetes bacterium]|nr:ChaN family lipoprotein [Planctomycetota bacterium]